MSRVQLALNVSNLEEAIDFYSKFFDTVPAKIRPGYANFAITDPPLKLVLMEGSGKPGSINHLGVEVVSTQDVTAETSRLAKLAMVADVEEGTTCCYAVQDKVWVDGPDASRWEIFTVLSDAKDSDDDVGEVECCVTNSMDESVTDEITKITQ